MKKSMSILTVVLLLLSSCLFIVIDSDDSDAYVNEFPLRTIAGRIAYDGATHEIDPSEIGYFWVEGMMAELSDEMFIIDKTNQHLDGLRMSGCFDSYSEGYEKSTSYNNDILTVTSLSGHMDYSFNPSGDFRLFRIPGNEDTTAFDTALGHTLASEASSVTVEVSSFDYRIFYADSSEYDKTPYDDGGHNAWHVLNRSMATRMTLEYTATATVTFNDLSVKTVSITRSYSSDSTQDLTHVSEHTDHTIVTYSDSVTLRTGDVTLNSTAKDGWDVITDIGERNGDSSFAEDIPPVEYDGLGYTVRIITKGDVLSDAFDAGLITYGEFGYDADPQQADPLLKTVSARINYLNAKNNMDPSDRAYNGISVFKNAITDMLFDCNRNDVVNDITVSGYLEGYLSRYDAGNNYAYDEIEMISMNGTMNYTFTTSGNGRLFMNFEGVDTTAFDEALGHVRADEVSSVTVDVTSCDYKMFEYDLSEYDKTPYVKQGNYVWHSLNITVVQKMEFSATAVATITFTDSSVKTVTIDMVTSYVVNAMLTHVSEHYTQSVIEVSRTMTFTTGDASYTNSVQSREDTGKTPIAENRSDAVFGELGTVQVMDGDGYNIRLVSRNDILRDSAEAGMITDGEYGYHSDNSNVTETEDEVNVSFTEEDASMNEDTVSTVIAKAEAKNSNVTLSLKDADITLSPAALKRLSSDENGTIRNLQVSVKVDSKLDDALVEKAKANGLSADTVVLAISIDITGSGKTDDLGNVEVSIPFGDAKDDVSYAVYYVDNAGNYTLMKDCKVVKDSDGNKSIVFTTDHFSTFVVMPVEKDNLGDVPLYIVIGLITVCALYLLLGMFRKSN